VAEVEARPIPSFHSPQKVFAAMRISRALWVIAAPLLIWALALRGQERAANPQAASSTQSVGQGPATREAPVARSVARLVVVDVVVSDDGKPVKGLAQQAFHLSEDGREQSLKVFEEHNSADASQIQNIPALPANIYTNFPETTVTAAANVLLLDALNTPAKDQMYVRQQMIEYLKTIPTGSRIAIFTLASRLRMVEGFTSDRRVLLAALNNKKNGATESPLLDDPNDASVTNLNTNMQAMTQAIGDSSQVMDSLAQFQADLSAFQMDLRVQMTLDALKELAEYLGGIPGRKNLIWFSGSFPINLDPDSTLGNEFSPARQYADRLKTTGDLLAAERVAVYPVDARGLFPSSVFNAGNPNSSYSGVSTSPPGGQSGGGAGAGGRRPRLPSGGNSSNPNSFARDSAKFAQTTAAEHATMQQIAEETGGHAYYDTNGIKDAVASAIESGEKYYTLAYTPSDANFDGKFRKIEVKFAGDKKYRLAYRPGYFADAPDAHTSDTPLSATASAIQRGAPASSEILFKVRVLPSDDPSLKGLQSQPGPAGALADHLHPPVKRYWIDYAADMHQVAANAGMDGLYHASLEFVALAYDRDGKTLNVTARAVKLNLQPAQYERVMQVGMPLHQEIDVPAGEVYLRLAVHDLTTDRIGSMEIPLRVTEPVAAK
jgi:VWFA-related protein